MARISKAPEVRRQEIVEVAKDLFVSQGYEQTTVSDIVKGVGVAQGLFYYYFSSKQDVFFAVMDQFIECAIADLAIHLRDAAIPPLVRIQNLMRSLPGFLKELERLYPSRQKSMPPEMNAVMQSHVCELLEPMVAKVFREGAEEGSLNTINPERMARFFIFGFIGIETMQQPPQAQEMLELITHAAERLLLIPRQALETDAKQEK